MELPSPEELKGRRKELGLTQAELAERAGVSQPMIARIEGGSVDPKLSTYRRIVEALKSGDGGSREAREIMHRDVISVAPDDSVGEAAELMRGQGFSQLPVLDDGVPVGSVTEAEIVRQINLEGQQVTSRRVEELMEGGLPTISPSTAVEVISKMLEHEPALLVVEEGSVVGVVTNADVMRVLE